MFQSAKPRSSEDRSPIAYADIDDVSYAGLGPCRALVAFIADRMYQVHLDCPKNESSEAVLRRLFGAPSGERDEWLLWEGEKTSIALHRKSGRFTFTDRTLNEVANRLILGLAAQQRGGGGSGPATRRSGGGSPSAPEGR